MIMAFQLVLVNLCMFLQRCRDIGEDSEASDKIEEEMRKGLECSPHRKRLKELGVFS